MLVVLCCRKQNILAGVQQFPKRKQLKGTTTLAKLSMQAVKVTIIYCKNSHIVFDLFLRQTLSIKDIFRWLFYQ